MEKKEIIPLVTEPKRYEIEGSIYHDQPSGLVKEDPEGEWMKAEEVIADRRLSEKRIEELEQALKESPGVATHSERGTPILWESVCTDPKCHCKQSQWVFKVRTLLSTPKHP